MASITLSERDLNVRRNALHELFTPLRAGYSRVAIEFAKDRPGGMIKLVATDRKASEFHSGDAGFRTKNATLRCRYFELWQGTLKDRLSLYRAYFTLLLVDPETRSLPELLCIHTDPSDADDLKQGPHLHISCARDPIPHCHFPLEFGFLTDVLKDPQSLTSAMQRAISLVARDVLPRFK